MTHDRKDRHDLFADDGDSERRRHPRLLGGAHHRMHRRRGAGHQSARLALGEQAGGTAVEAGAVEVDGGAQAAAEAGFGQGDREAALGEVVRRAQNAEPAELPQQSGQAQLGWRVASCTFGT